MIKSPGLTDDLAEVDDERHLLPDRLRERPLLQNTVPGIDTQSERLSTVGDSAGHHRAACGSMYTVDSRRSARALALEIVSYRPGWLATLSGHFKQLPVNTIHVHRATRLCPKLAANLIVSTTHCVNQSVAKLNFPGSPFMSASPMCVPTSYSPRS